MIIVFGSLNMDMVFPVSVMPTAGNTLLCPRYSLHPGGKGANQAAAAARNGASVKMYGSIGQDLFGHQVKQSLEATGVDCGGVNSCDTPTGCATICVDAKGENMITVASGANLQARATLVPDEVLDSKATVVLQMEVPLEENQALIERAHTQGSRIILNLAPAHPLPAQYIQMLDILVLNQLEATQLARDLKFDVTSPTLVARRLSSQFGLSCIVTLGADGAFLSSRQGAWSVDAMRIKAVDTTAAGDAFVGCLAASLDYGHALEEALQRAVVASGLACTKAGAIPSLPTQDEIDAVWALAPQLIRSI